MDWIEIRIIWITIKFNLNCIFLSAVVTAPWRSSSPGGGWDNSQKINPFIFCQLSHPESKKYTFILITTSKEEFLVVVKFSHLSELFPENPVN